VARVSNEAYENRTERLNKVVGLLEIGVSPKDIAAQLGIKYSTVTNDIDLLTTINKGSLSPEICAEKRLEIDGKFVQLDDEVYNAYRSLFEEGKHKGAIDYLKVCVDIRKYRAKLWGLEQAESFNPSVSADSINFTNFNVSLKPGDIERMRRSALD
jgi:hypothetical protein